MTSGRQVPQIRGTDATYLQDLKALIDVVHHGRVLGELRQGQKGREDQNPESRSSPKSQHGPANHPGWESLLLLLLEEGSRVQVVVSCFLATAEKNSPKTAGQQSLLVTPSDA